MSRQPSASYTGLLLACPRPFHQGAVRESTREMLVGEK